MRSKGKVVNVSRPYELWEADMSYVWCGKDLVLSVQCCRRLQQGVGIVCVRYTCAEGKRHQSVTNALALHGNKIRVSSLSLRVDNGSQYWSRAFRQSMQVFGIRTEFIFRNTPERNGHIESFHKTLKKEYIWPYDFQNYQEAEIAISNAFADYNRIHSALGYKTPYEFLEQWEMDK